MFLIYVFESRRKAFDNSRRGIRKGERTSSPMQDGDASIPRDRGILTQGGEVLPNWGRKKSRSSTLGEEVNRHLCTQASHRWRELWRVLQESRKNFGKKKENRGRTRQWQPPTLPPRIPRVREGEWFLCIERGRRREKIWWETRSREILWSLTEVFVESGLSGDEN